MKHKAVEQFKKVHAEKESDFLDPIVEKSAQEKQILLQEAINKALGAGISEQIARSLIQRNEKNIEVLLSLL